MTFDPHDQAAVQTRLWDSVEKHQTGMLGLVGGAPHHFQPMTAFLERSTNQIWFYTYRDTDLVRATSDGSTAMFVFQEGHDLYACIGGELRSSHDRVRMDKYWNAVVAAWYPGGKDDPRLTMLVLDCADAEVWISEAGPARFAWEIAKANASHKTPDLGAHTHINFH